MIKIEIKKVQKYNNAKHCLISSENGMHNVINSLIGLHSARLITPISTLNSRLDLFTPEELFAETFVKNNLIKLRCMRGTLHTVDLTMAPIVHQATKKKRLSVCLGILNKLNINAKKISFIEELILTLLEEKELASKDIEHYLLTKYNTANLITRAVIKKLWESGDVCYLNKSLYWGSETRVYALTRKRYPTLVLDSISEEEAITKLVYFYIKQYGPVTEKDIIWWIGLPSTSIRKALNILSEKLCTVSIGQTELSFFLLTEDLEDLQKTQMYENQNNIKLLAYEDPFLKGYFESRFRYVSESIYPKLFNPIGEARSSIMKNGQVIGLWYFDRKRNYVDTELFQKLSKFDLNKLDFEISKTIKCLSRNERN